MISAQPKGSCLTCEESLFLNLKNNQESLHADYRFWAKTQIQLSADVHVWTCMNTSPLNFSEMKKSWYFLSGRRKETTNNLNESALKQLHFIVFLLRPWRVSFPCSFHISGGHSPRPLSSCIIYRCVKGPNYTVCAFHRSRAAGLVPKSSFSSPNSRLRRIHSRIRDAKVNTRV